MLDVFNFPSPQQSNYQEFYGGGTARDWVKPRGVSMVRFMLIGAGGGGGSGSSVQGCGGGGSGAVTSWIGPAIFIPDILRVTIGAGGVRSINGGDTTIIYQAKNGTGYTLLTANGGVSGTTDIPAGTGGTASANNYFGAAGIFTSIAGQAGGAGSASTVGVSVTASATTFLSGGAGGNGATGAGTTVAINYGYPTSVAAPAGANPGQDGFFITQPVLVGRGGSGGSTTTALGGSGGIGGIGCGGGASGEDGGNTGGRGGDGAVFIWAW
jgi:hypothetical protein